jgi:hypothetical protein
VKTVKAVFKTIPWRMVKWEDEKKWRELKKEREGTVCKGKRNFKLQNRERQGRRCVQNV